MVLPWFSFTRIVQNTTGRCGVDLEGIGLPFKWAVFLLPAPPSSPSSDQRVRWPGSSSQNLLDFSPASASVLVNSAGHLCWLACPLRSLPFSVQEHFYLRDTSSKKIRTSSSVPTKHCSPSSWTSGQWATCVQLLAREQVPQSFTHPQVIAVWSYVEANFFPALEIPQVR